MTSGMMDTVTSIQDAGAPAEIARHLSRFAALSGYEFWHIGRASSPDIPLAKKKLLDAWPLAWMRQYDHEQLVRDDAIWQSCRTAQGSFRWSDVSIPDQRARRVMTIAETEFRMCNGLCVPFHGLEGYEGAISFAGKDVDRSRCSDLSLEVVAIYAFNRFNEIQTAQPQAKLLTARQREVMQWVAAGKTAWDIAEILHISKETVRTTTKAAMSRLNVHTRAHAIAEALRLKEIDR